VANAGCLGLQFLYIWEDSCIDAQRLEDSLREALSAYPAIAGRFVGKGELGDAESTSAARIAFTNEGVPFKIVKGHPGSAKEIPSGAEGPPLWKFADHPDMFPENGGPLFSAKLTCFETGGCILGLYANHIVFDGWTFASFMRDWSSIHCGQTVLTSLNDVPQELMKHPSPEDFAAYQKDNNLELAMRPWVAKILMKLMMSMMKKVGKKHDQRKCIINFNEEELRRLKAQAESSAGTWVSTNEALLAHLHPLLLEVFDVSTTGKVGAKVPVNLRGKVTGSNERVVGNNVAVAFCVYDLREGEKMSVPARVHEAMRSKLSEKSLVNWMQVYNLGYNAHKYYVCKDLPRGTPGIIEQWNYQVTTPYLEVDFGVGKPTRAQPWSLEPVKVMQSLQGGVDVMISKGGHSISSWAKDKYGSLSKALSLSQLVLLCVLWRRRRAATMQQLSGGGLIFAACVAVKALLSKRHARYVETCFKALEEHPQLRPHPQPVAVVA
jgi:hypothetical protein